MIHILHHGEILIKYGAQFSFILFWLDTQIAKHLSAGGQWRTHALPGQEQCEWDVQTFESWKGILEDELKCPDMPFEERSGLGVGNTHRVEGHCLTVW